MRCCRSLRVLTLALVGCGGPKDAAVGDTGTEPGWCEDATAHVWDPTGATEIQLFPDGLLEIDAPGSPTGRGLSVSLDRAPWADDLPELLSGAVLSLEDLSGFGTLGGQLLRFDAPVTGLPTTAEESVSSEGWQLVDLSTSPPSRVPYEVEVLEDGLTVVLWPLRPLTMGAAHALVVTTEATARDGGCVSPSVATRSLLWGTPDDPVLAEAAPRYRSALDELGLAAEDVSALSVYTVHADVSAVQAIGEHLATVPVEWSAAPVCVPEDGLRVCTGSLPLLDYRDDRGAVDADVSPREADAPATIWLPEGEGPWPVVVFGHGLGSSRGEGALLARQMGDVGFAVVALDAVEHGDHPWAGGSEDDDALRFLGFDFAAFSLETRALRGNFDQTVLDRRRLVTLLQQSPDFDGDGIPELDTTRLSYLGISLGAILGPGLLTVAPELQGGVLSVGGARLIAVATESEDFATFEPVVAQAVGSIERYERLIAVAQHTVDPADPGTWAQRTLTARPRPHLLSQVGLHDEVVPPHTGHALARAFDLPQLTPVYEPVELLTVVDAASVSGNVAGATAAFSQFDQVTAGEEGVDATHQRTPQSVEGWAQMITFLETWIETGTPTAIDSTGPR